MSEKIKFQTTRFGELEVEKDSVLTIRNGLIGFPQFDQYVILEHNPPFSWLQSISNAELAFVIVNGAEFGEHYEVKIPTDDPDFNEAAAEDLAIVNLVSIRGSTTETTVNLKAPLIVNSKTRKGRQVVLDDLRYSTRFPLWEQGKGE